MTEFERGFAAAVAERNPHEAREKQGGRSGLWNGRSVVEDAEDHIVEDDFPCRMADVDLAQVLEASAREGQGLHRNSVCRKSGVCESPAQVQL